MPLAQFARWDLGPLLDLEPPTLALNALLESFWTMLALLQMLVMPTSAPLALEVLLEPFLKEVLLVTVAFVQRESTRTTSTPWHHSLHLMDAKTAPPDLTLLAHQLATSNVSPAFLANTLPVVQVLLVSPPALTAKPENTVILTVLLPVLTVLTALILQHPPHHAPTALTALDLKQWPRTE